MQHEPMPTAEAVKELEQVKDMIRQGGVDAVFGRKRLLLVVRQATTRPESHTAELFPHPMRSGTMTARHVFWLQRPLCFPTVKGQSGAAFLHAELRPSDTATPDAQAAVVAVSVGRLEARK